MSATSVMEHRHEFPVEVPGPALNGSGLPGSARSVAAAGPVAHPPVKYGTNHAGNLDAPLEQPTSLWRSQLQLEVLLSGQAKLLPLLEGLISGGSMLSSGPAPAGVDSPSTGEVGHPSIGKGSGSGIKPPDESLTAALLEVHSGQTLIRDLLQEQKNQWKGTDDQLLRLREAVERNTLEHRDLSEDLRSAAKLVHILVVVAIVLAIGMAGIAAYLLRHSFI